jgi:hypothetical protein
MISYRIPKTWMEFYYMNLLDSCLGKLVVIDFNPWKGILEIDVNP